MSKLIICFCVKPEKFPFIFYDSFSRRDNDDLQEGEVQDEIYQQSYVGELRNYV